MFTGALPKRFCIQSFPCYAQRTCKGGAESHHTLRRLGPELSPTSISLALCRHVQLACLPFSSPNTYEHSNLSHCLMNTGRYRDWWKTKENNSWTQKKVTICGFQDFRVHQFFQIFCNKHILLSPFEGVGRMPCFRITKVPHCNFILNHSWLKRTLGSLNANTLCWRKVERPGNR